MASETLPISLYESLMIKLIAVLEITQNPEGVTTPQAKQALLQATNEFKNALAQAKELALALPGGELTIEEQDEIIDMLEQMKKRKQQRLARFSTRVLSSSVKADQNRIDVDSVASTPVAQD